MGAQPRRRQNWLSRYRGRSCQYQRTRGWEGGDTMKRVHTGLPALTSVDYLQAHFLFFLTAGVLGIKGPFPFARAPLKVSFDKRQRGYCASP